MPSAFGLGIRVDPHPRHPPAFRRWVARPAAGVGSRLADILIGPMEHLTRPDGIHRIRVPATPLNALAIVVLTAAVLMQWPSLRWLVLASLGLGLLMAAGLIVLRRRARGAPPAARLNFPPPAGD
jgi:hypothetical protein